MIPHRDHPAVRPPEAPPYASARERELLAELAAEREARATAEARFAPADLACREILLLAGAMDAAGAATSIEAARLRILEVAAAGCGVENRTGG